MMDSAFPLYLKPKPVTPLCTKPINFILSAVFILEKSLLFNKTNISGYKTNSENAKYL